MSQKKSEPGRITPQRLAEIKARCAAATEGPWFGPRVTDLWPPGWVGVYAADESGNPIPGDIVGVTGRYDEESSMADADFIAHSRKDLEDAIHDLELASDEIENMRRL